MTKRLYLALAAAGAVLLAFLGLTSCPAPDPVTPPAAIASPMPASTAAASNSTAATATGTIRATIRRPVAGPHAPQIKSENLHNGTEVQSGSGGPHAQNYEEIVIEVTQTATAVASSEASAGAGVLSPAQERPEIAGGEHARLGAFVGTVPGAIAISYQLADVEIPPWVIGTPLELGLEVEGNTQQLGAGVSVGSKAFATGGGYLGWDGPGWYVGLGMRF